MLIFVGLWSHPPTSSSTRVMKRTLFAIVALATTTVAATAADTILSASSLSRWRAERKVDWVLRVYTGDVASLALGFNASEIRITEEQVQDLVLFAAQQGFFDLPDELGTKELDLPVRSLTLLMNGRKKTVTMYGTRNPDGLTGDDIAATPGLDRFLIVWAAMRGLFDHPRAADDRKSDQRALRDYEKKKAAK